MAHDPIQLGSLLVQMQLSRGRYDAVYCCIKDVSEASQTLGCLYVLNSIFDYVSALSLVAIYRPIYVLNAFGLDIRRIGAQVILIIVTLQRVESTIHKSQQS